MKFIALKKHLAEEEIQPCYIITGDDQYIVKKAAQSFRSLALAMPEFNLHIFSQGSKGEDIINALKSLPLLGDRVVVEVSSSNLDVKDIAEYLKSPSKDAVLVIIAPTISKALSSLAKSTCVVECDRLDETSLKKWAIKRCAENGSQISENAAARLVAYCERYMYRIESECDKLSCYRLDDTIDVQDVEMLVSPSAEFKIYELGDAILSGRGEKALNALRTIMEDTSGGYVISGLYSYFRRLLYVQICKDAAIAEYLGVKEFAVTASRRQASKFSPKKLKAICDKFQAADYEFKSGKITDTLAAQTIVMQTIVEISENR